MREPLLLLITPLGWSLYYTEDKDGTTTASGYCADLDETPQKIIAEGKTTILDTRPMERSDQITVAFKAPLLERIVDPVLWEQRRGKSIFKHEFEEGTGLDGCGYGPMSFAPLEVFLSLYERRGARIVRVPQAELTNA